MSDALERYRRLLKGPAYRSAQLTAGRRPEELTESQREFAPYIAETAAREAKKNRRIQPLKWIFDLLQRGQYMGVNLLSEVTESIQNREPVGQAAQEALVGLWQGLTGKRKGDFEEFLREVLPPETVEKMERPILGEKQRGKFLLGAAPIDIAGLAGNIALDPLTYFDPLKLVRVGGLASKAGRSAAREAATDTTLVALKKMASFKNFDDLAKGFDIQKFTRLWDTAPKEATEYMVRNQPEMARVANEVYKKAYKKALVTPAETLRGGLAKEIDDILAKAQPDYSKALQEATAAGGQEAVERTKEVWEKAFMGPLREIRDKATGVPEVPSRIIPGGATVTPGGAGVSPKIDVAPAALTPGSQAIPAAYEGAGTRAWHFLGKEIPLPDAQGPNVVQRSIERFSDMIKATPAGKTIGDAWWSWNSQGVLGEIRRAVGIRNPYEKMLRFRELESRQLEANVAIMAKNAFLAVDEFDDETLQQVFKALDTAEVMKGGDPAFDLIKALDDPDFLAKADITGDPEELKRAWEQIHALQESYIGLMDEAVALGIADNHGYIENYLPTQYKQPRGGKRQARIVRQGKTKGSASGFMKKRKQPHVLTVEQEKSQIKALFPRIGDDIAEKLIRQQNVGSFQANLRDLLVYRAVAQAKLQGHVNIVKAFKEFGVPTDLAQGYLRGQVRKSGGGLPAAGLQQIEGKPFKGLLFDSVTAEILNRAVKSTSDYLKPIKSLLGGFTAWWKGVVTMTTGFHMRNHISNNITGFLKFGPRWFQMRQYQAPAMAGALYALHKADVRGILKEVGMSEGMFMSLLNRRIVKELADNAFQRGVITHHTKAFDPSFTAEQFGQGFLRRGSFNPMSQENLGFRGSRKIGDVVENHPRFQSFLMDIDDVAKRTGGDATDSALDFASMEAKKWFIDYCFDEKTEIMFRRGWLKWHEVTPQDESLAYNQETGKLEWTELADIHINDYAGEMYKIENKSMDALVTPNHKWVKVGGKQGGLRIKPKSSLIETEDMGSVKLIVSAEYGGGNKTYSDEFIELVGWILSEGTYPKHRAVRKDRPNGNGTRINHITLYQSESHNPQYVKRIRMLAKHFADAGERFTESKYKMSNGVLQWYIGGDLSKRIRDLFPDKILTYEFVNTLTAKQAKLLMLTLCRADGTKKKYKSGGEHWEFTQKDHRFMAVFQHLAMLAGHRTVLREREDTMTCSILRKDNRLYTRGIIEETYYEGKIWCVTNKYHTLVARRNGRVYISGNSDLSDFERNILRGFIPFYSWLRHNIANQMSGVLLYPELYSILPKLEDAVKVEDPSYDETMIPDYMKQFGFFPVMGEDGKFTMFNPNIPIQDLNRIPIVFGDRAPIPSLNELKDDLFASAHPIVKTIVQMLPKKGYDMFYKRDLDYDADAPAALRFFVKTPRMLQWLDGFAKDILNIDEGLGIHLSKDKKVKMNAKIVKVLNDNLPLIRVIDRTLLAANQIIPGFEEAATEAVGFYDTYDMSPPDKMERFFQLLSYYGGIKFKVTDIEENRARWKTDVINKAKEERFRERKREQTGESRELGYLKKRGELLETYDFIF
jgi:hypothetical protein